MAIFDRKEDYLYIRWAKAVKNRDFYTCQLCGQSGGELHSHHLNAWNAFPDERYDVSNGATLCTMDHELFHKIYGVGDNTKEQFEEFEKMYSLFLKAQIKKNAVESIRETALAKLKADIDGYERHDI